MEYTILGNTEIEVSKLCVGCMSFGKAGHLARDKWESESLRGQTDRVARGKYDRMEEQDIRIVSRVKELTDKYQCKMSQIAIAWQWVKGVTSSIKENPKPGVVLLDEKK